MSEPMESRKEDVPVEVKSSQDAEGCVELPSREQLMEEFQQKQLQELVPVLRNAFLMCNDFIDIGCCYEGVRKFLKSKVEAQGFQTREVFREASGDNPRVDVVRVYLHAKPEQDKTVAENGCIIVPRNSENAAEALKALFAPPGKRQPRFEKK